MQIVQEHMTEARQNLTREFSSIQGRYDYGDLPDMHPNSPDHMILLDMIMQRATAASDVVKRVQPEWRKIAHNMEAFVPLDDAESLTKSADYRRPVRVVVPLSYATSEALKTTMTSIFLRNPIHPIRGRGPEDQFGALLLERLLQAQSVWFKEFLAWHTIWNDAFTFSLGIAETKWERRYVRRMQDEQVDSVLQALRKETGNALGEVEGDIIRFFADELLFEGQRLRPIDPFNWLPDPNVTPNEIQDSEFLGYTWHWNAMDLLSEEAEPDTDYFNGLFARMLADSGLGKSRLVGDTDTGRGERWDLENIRDTIRAPFTNRLDLVQMYIKLIPSEWGLSHGKVPEIWDFCAAGDRVIIKAQKSKFAHGMYPITVCAPTTNGHDVLPVSMIATTFGLQEAIDFYISSHVANVRKSLNDMFVVDTSAIEWEDLLDPGPGKLIRLKSHVAGSGNIDQYIKQFQVTDVTSNHQKDAQGLMQMLKESIGTTDITQGNLQQLPERPTAALGGAAMNRAMSRLNMIGMKIGAQSVYDVGFQGAFNTQQFMSQTTAVETIGRYEGLLKKIFNGASSVQATIANINVAFDMIPLDGSVPGLENVEAHTQIMNTLLTVPGVGEQIAAGMDLPRFFANWMRLTGATNALDFFNPGNGSNVTAQVLPDQEVDDQAQAGNIVPIREAA